MCLEQNLERDLVMGNKLVLLGQETFAYMQGGSVESNVGDVIQGGIFGVCIMRVLGSVLEGEKECL